MKNGPSELIVAAYTRAYTVSLCTCSYSFTLKMKAIRSSETSVLIRATRRHLAEDDNHHSHCRGNLKSNMPYICRF
jgi:hypothetical protein